ncbi:hypothetical protein [Bythopirellula polymerisocia]|uniref:Uncharacterized protein n=1 Tax=Bythopirellula polymerisocia TaxID=2528003 RepID=A0A5C6CCW0_9BACT|nr:hypothetical protein [Bythopirellula polymerisocia]TWU21294.1 hypothetical protein Pla144_47030 [Bythopirellula polymerisocia]
MYRLLEHLRRFSKLSLAVLLLLPLLGISLFAKENHNSVPSVSGQFSPSKHSRGEFEESSKIRIREGTLIVDKGGYFRQDGEGATFVTEDKYEFGALPNLNLERIVRTLKSSDESESIRWSVNGVVTEFNGRNHILISRAVYKSSVPPPIPEQIVN